LNTLGVLMARIDYAPGGLNPPHTYPRATKMILCLKVNWMRAANVVISKHIMKRENFVFSIGFVYFHKNNGKVPAAVVVGFNSQLPGIHVIASTLFGAMPLVKVV
ncbi:unnamed protein product, partial [Ilex paraguariensis]